MYIQITINVFPKILHGTVKKTLQMLVQSTWIVYFPSFSICYHLPVPRCPVPICATGQRDQHCCPSLRVAVPSPAVGATRRLSYALYCCPHSHSHSPTSPSPAVESRESHGNFFFCNVFFECMMSLEMCWFPCPR